MQRAGASAHAAILLAALLASQAERATASGLLQAAVGPGDTAIHGSAVAEPRSPSGALFANPAGLVRFTESTVSSGTGIAIGREHVRGTGEPLYSDDNDIAALVPDFGASIAPNDRWRYGFGLYGSVGMNYDFEPDPAAGSVYGYFSECSIVGAPLAVAYRASDRLWIGASVVPLFGYLRTHYAVDDLPFRYTLTGPGVQGMTGLTWKPSDRWSLGLALRTPGRIWMDGSMPGPLGDREDVDLTIEMPVEVALGVTRRLAERLELSASVRWTDSSTLGDSLVTFDALPGVAAPFVPAAKDEWRFALGAEYALTARVTLRGGVGHGTHIVGTRGVSPLIYDVDDTRIGIGAALSLGRWTLEATTGYQIPRERHVDAASALLLAGRYRVGGGILMFGVTYRWERE